MIKIFSLGRFPKARLLFWSYEDDRKFEKSQQILNQTKRINELYLGNISRQKTVRIKFSVDSVFSTMLYGKKQ